MWALLSFSFIDFHSYELLTQIGLSVLKMTVFIMSHYIIALVRLFLFGLDHMAQVPYEWRGTDDTLTVSKAITMNSCNGRNVLFPQVIYFKWTAVTLPVCFLSSFIPLAFFKNINELEWLLVGIKFLILFSCSRLIVFSLYCHFRHIRLFFSLGTWLICLLPSAALYNAPEETNKPLLSSLVCVRAHCVEGLVCSDSIQMPLIIPFTFFQPLRIRLAYLQFLH